MILGKIRKVCKVQRMIAWGPHPRRKKNFVSTSKKVPKNSN